MKIGIVTQPLSRNYGGILQNYALQQTLTKLGHTPYTFDLGKYTWKDWGIKTIKSIIKKIMGRPCYLPETPSRFYTKERILRRFVDSYISLITPRTHKPHKKQVFQYHLDAIIVGSDQVWRPKYNYRIESMFLDFTQGLNIKRIAYAASFGTDKWKYSPTKSKACAEFARQFDAISVREETGVNLCKKYLGVDATHLLDPTLLLAKEMYEELLTHIPVSESPYLFAYTLDPTDEKLKYIKKCAAEMGLEVRIKGADTNLSEEDCIENWLANFRDAQYVITDSFHGSVFSIIFNKPFIALGNRARGMSRFNSLLKIFGLKDRLIDYTKNKALPLDTPNWVEINEIISLYREKSIEFLLTNL
uniref:polysaccharide pyruvyl transferase family protein n=1 Tax=Alistipes sp. TaxID=1872444 RepID=UPI004056B907